MNHEVDKMLPNFEYTVIKSPVISNNTDYSKLSNYNIPLKGVYSNDNEIVNNPVTNNINANNINTFNKEIPTLSNYLKVKTMTPISNIDTSKLTFKKGVNLDKVDAELKNVINEYNNRGVKLRITEGFADRGHAKNSWHYKGNALDITPVEGQSFSDLIGGLQSHPDLIDKLKNLGYKLYDERYRQGKNWTGAHLHIGKDTNVNINSWNTIKGMKGLKIFKLNENK